MDGNGNGQRLPPHEIHAEAGVLGCILLSPLECLPVCLTTFKGGSHVFYDLRHRCLYDCLVDMLNKQQPIDIITIENELKKRQQLDKVGGLSYLATLPDATPSAANINHYNAILVEQYALRQLIMSATTSIQAAYHPPNGSIQEVMDKAQAGVFEAANQLNGESTVHMAKPLIDWALARIDAIFEHKGLPDGIATGLVDLDKMTGGLHKGTVFVIAGRPGTGKSALAMCIAEHVTVVQHLPVCVFSLEMTAESLMLRTLCCRAKLSLSAVRHGYYYDEDKERVASASCDLCSAPLFIDDMCGLSIMQLRARARRMQQQYGIQLFIVDYMQLLHSTNKKADNRQTEVADISNGIKSMAKELDAPVIALAQLNRDIERDKKRKPRMSDLRESGAIEADADVLGLLYRPQESDEEFIQTNLYLAKQRNGPTGEIGLMFKRPFTRFESLSKVQDEATVQQHAQEELFQGEDP